MIPLLIGAGAGAVLVTTLYRMGALQDRSGLAVLVGAVALFWPVFAVQAEAGVWTILLHMGVFFGFCALAAYGFRTSATVLAAALMAHGVFDGLAWLTGHPGPAWWPALCAGLDIVAGLAVLLLVRSNRIPA